MHHDPSTTGYEARPRHMKQRGFLCVLGVLGVDHTVSAGVDGVVALRERLRTKLVRVLLADDGLERDRFAGSEVLFGETAEIEANRGAQKDVIRLPGGLDRRERQWILRCVLARLDDARELLGLRQIERRPLP